MVVTVSAMDAYSAGGGREMTQRHAGFVFAAVVVVALGAGCGKAEPPVEEVIAGRAVAHLREAAQAPGDAGTAAWGLSEVRLFGEGDGPGPLLRDVFGTWRGNPWTRLGARWWPSAWDVAVRKSAEQPPTYLVDVRFWCDGRKGDGTTASWERNAVVKVVEATPGEYVEELVRFEGEQPVTFGAKLGHWFAVLGLGVLMFLGSSIITRFVAAGAKGFWSGVGALAWSLGMALPFSILLVGGIARGAYDAFGGSILAAILGVLTAALGTLILGGIAIAAASQNS
jgi:hypothetical protein